MRITPCPGMTVIVGEHTLTHKTHFVFPQNFVRQGQPLRAEVVSIRRNYSIDSDCPGANIRLAS
jgi:hypothetical protein